MTRHKILAIGAATALLASSASAALVWNLDTVYENNGAIPSGSAPWATLTLEDVGSSLELTIQSKLLVGSGNFFDKIGLSYTGTTPASPTLTQGATSGTFVVDSASSTSATLPGGQTFNIVIDFNNAVGSRFDGSDSVVYSINAANVTPDFTTLLSGNMWTVAAHVNGLGTGNQISAGITGGFQEIPVPEPSTYIAGALLLLPFAASTVRRFRRK